MGSTLCQKTEGPSQPGHRDALCTLAEATRSSGYTHTNTRTHTHTHTHTLSSIISLTRDDAASVTDLAQAKSGLFGGNAGKRWGGGQDGTERKGGRDREKSATGNVGDECDRGGRLGRRKQQLHPPSPLSQLEKASSHCLLRSIMLRCIYIYVPFLLPCSLRALHLCGLRNVVRLLRGAFLCCGAIRLRGDAGSSRQREGRVALKLAFIVIFFNFTSC